MWHRRGMALWVLVALGWWTGCEYDADARCGPGQVLVGGTRCICAEGTAYTARGCEVCEENEVAGPNGCVCVEGFQRVSSDAPCELAQTALGKSCDLTGAPCTDEVYAYCQASPGGAGYCTTTGCASSQECESAYACNTSANPSYCQRPPVGLGQSCTSGADCAGTEATWCDTFMTHQCIVEGCSLTAQDCFGDNVCCDLSRFGVPVPLCLPPGAC